MGIAIRQGYRYSFFDMKCSEFKNSCNSCTDAVKDGIRTGSSPRRERFERSEGGRLPPWQHAPAGRLLFVVSN